MSSLEAQLAALDKDNKHPGAVYNTSKRHDEATGRGLQFSVQTGRTMPGGPKFKPTIVHETPQQAADIPIRVLQEKALEAIDELLEFDPTFDFDITNATKQTIPKILSHMTIFLGENSETIQQNTIQVIEYLIRKYDIHLKYMQDFVWTFLPQHQRLPVLFRRALGLVDLASNQSYLWLRPYADEKVTSSLPRQVIANNLFKNVDLLRCVVKLANAVSKHPDSRGSSYTISFTAALLVEGLTLYAKRSNRDDEEILRILLPSILTACGDNRSDDFTNWGYIVASYVTETMDLSSKTITRIGKAILKGSSSLEAMTVVISLLMPPPAQPINEESYLILPDGKALGCEMPRALFENCLEVEGILDMLGVLKKERNLVIEPFVASLLSFGYSDPDFVTGVLQHKGIGRLWNDRFDFVGALTARAVQDVLDGIDPGKFASLFDCLRRCNRASCDAAVQYVLHRNGRLNEQQATKIKTLFGEEDRMAADSSDANSASLLPPMVALEHADPSIRLEAVTRLERSTGDPEELLESFLRRIAVDDTVDVAIRAATASLTLIKNYAQFAQCPRLKEYGELLVDGNRQWAQRNSRALSEALTLLSSSIAALLKQKSPDIWFELVICIFVRSRDGEMQSLAEACDVSVDIAEEFILHDATFLRDFLEKVQSDKALQNLLVIANRNEEFLKRSVVCMEKILKIVNKNATKSSSKTWIPSLVKEVEKYFDFCLRCNLSRICHVEAIISLASSSSETFYGQRRESLLQKIIETSDGMHALAFAIFEADEASIVILLRCVVARLQEGPLECPADLLLALLHSLNAGSARIDGATFEIFRLLSGKSQKNPFLVAFGKFALQNKSLVQGGKLSMLLSLVEKADDRNTLRDGILNLCCRYLDENCVHNVEKAYEYLSQILQSVDDAGEGAFGVLDQWNSVGRKALVLLLDDGALDSVKPLPLIKYLVRLIKGIVRIDPEIIITTEPSRNGRKRSYSVGKFDGLKFVEPYPDDFFDAIAKILSPSSANHSLSGVVATLLDEVIASPSWQKEIFFKAKDADRMRILGILLGLPKSLDCQRFHLSSMPIRTGDLTRMLKEVDLSTDPVKALDIVDLMNNHLSTVSLDEKSGKKVTEMLLDCLSSSRASSMEEDMLFVCDSIIRALDENLLDGRKQMCMSDAKAKAWLSTLTEWSLSNISLQRREACLRMIERLCVERPSSIPLCSDFIAKALSDSTDRNTQRLVIKYLVPVMWSGSSNSRKALFDLFSQEAKRFPLDDEDSSRSTLFDLFNSLLFSDSTSSLQNGHAVGYVVVTILAWTLDEEHEIGRAALQILGKLSKQTQVMALSALLDTGIGIASVILSREFESSIQPPLPPIDEITGTFKEGRAEGEGSSLFALLLGLSSIFSDALLAEDLCIYIRENKSSASTVLPMWQDMLQLYSTVSEESEGFEMQVEILEQVTLAKDRLQSLLPSPIFLASITNLMSESSSERSQVQTLKHLSDRLDTMRSYGDIVSESMLYLDLVPEIVTRISKAEPQRQNASILQASLVALEKIGRLFIGNTDNAFTSLQIEKYFAPVVTLLKNLFEHHGGPQTSRIDLHVIHLMSSACLCASTCVRILGTKITRVVPALVDGSTRVLASFYNETLESVAIEDERQLIYASFLGFFTSIFETIPTSVSARLPAILSKDCVLSRSLRAQSVSGGLKRVVDSFDSALVKKIPPRILVPAIEKVLSSFGETDSESTCALLYITRDSISGNASAQIVPHRTQIHRFILSCLEKAAMESHEDQILRAGSETMKSLVLRLSELQLRNLFVQFKEWNDGSVSLSSERSLVRRRAFHFVCACLSEELKSLFLPCLSICLTDLIEEIGIGASSLSSDRVKGEHDTKRRKTNKSEKFADADRSVIRSALATIDNALKHDAHEGGDWTRADDGKRYFTILDTVSKLTKAKAPLLSDDVSYNVFVLGSETSGEIKEGSVVSLLSNLAAAAGSEQLWKPLNQVLLDMCSDEDRFEVRRAGLLGLLQIMRSLGEEYMVLLPECLPVLSDLLEDSFDEINGLARDIISLAEDVLGESLEDSLR